MLELLQVAQATEGSGLPCFTCNEVAEGTPLVV